MSVDFAALGPAILFCPADRPDRYAKAAARADAVIIDLEDAVAPAARRAARAALIANRLDPSRTIVRVNPVGAADHALDVRAAIEAGYTTVMLAKTESACQVTELVAGARKSGAALEVVALCETAAGVLAASSIAAVPEVSALMWGAEDLVASLGGTSSRGADGRYRDVARHARSMVLLAAGAHGKAAIDSVHLDIADVSGVAAEAADAVAIGFAATACIHPDHVASIRASYRPNESDVATAIALVEASGEHSGVFLFEGQMVDEALLRHARRLMTRAAHTVS